MDIRFLERPGLDQFYTAVSKSEEKIIKKKDREQEMRVTIRDKMLKRCGPLTRKTPSDKIALACRVLK